MLLGSSTQGQAIIPITQSTQPRKRTMHHRFQTDRDVVLNDLVRGTTVSKVRHLVKIPVLLLRAQ